MSKKIRRVPVVLDAGEIKDLPPEDIRMILRGADELIFTGGRNMLAKLLKGSKDKKILEYKLNECPAYGYYHNLKLNDISKCVDWMIEIEKETFAEELYQRFCLDVKEKHARVIFELKEVNRQVVLRVLDKIEAEGTDEFLACLEAWRRMEVKKVVARITEVETTIKNRTNLSK